MKKLISLVLLVCMLMGMTFPLTVFAADEAEILLTFEGDGIDLNKVIGIYLFNLSEMHP